MKQFFVHNLSLMTLLLGACVQQVPKKADRNAYQEGQNASLPPVSATDFSSYWYQGVAELSTYTIEQDRYGQIRSGQQINVFVTEDLSQGKQVKLDNPKDAGKDAVPVLKLNAIRRFDTGIYDYSFMGSVFTPIDENTHRASLKYTCSIQDWCGQTFTQINRLDNAWRWRQFSYFEQEADTDTEIHHCLLEDEIFTKLRINPSQFDQLTTQVLPGQFYLRMKHLPATPAKATITSKIDGSKRITTIVYQGLPRSLHIEQEAAVPYRILAWEETEKGALFCKAQLNKTLMTDYWAKNGNEFSAWQDSLGVK